MISKFVYIFQYYAVFITFLLAFWGSGQAIFSRNLKVKIDDPILSTAIALVIGQGIFIVVLQCLAISGILRMPWILLVLVAGVIAGFIEWRRGHRYALLWARQSWQGLSKIQRYELLLIVIFSIPVLLAPLSPPMPGDELMYHLPHAQQWAESGRLGINEWLRYPWFPYNYNLLYAGAMVVYGDVFTHMFNMLAGLLVALITYRLGVRHFSSTVGFIAALIWLQVNRGDLGKANVDMGVTLYILAASIIFYLWVQTPKDRRWLALAAFLMGVAAGAKYQGLLFLPFFGLSLIWIDRKPSSWLIATVSLLIPCAYWYARNAIMTGDPFDPMGGKIFGFYDWNLSDYVAQFQDIKNHAKWPNWLFWPALFSIFIVNNWKSPTLRAMTVFSIYSVIIWLITSRYPRYLMPAFPFLALFAAQVWKLPFEVIADRLRIMSAFRWERTEKILSLLVFILILLSSIAGTARFWSRISTNDEQRQLFLQKTIKGYPVLEYANSHDMGKIYLFGSLLDAIYYAPHPIWGDGFGPWRYGDIISNEPAKFANALLLRNFDAVILDKSFAMELEKHPDFGHYFSLEFQSGGAILYRLKK